MKGVFLVQAFRYSFDYTAAIFACSDNDAVVASQSQLEAAWRGGYSICTCGWNSDKVARFPMTKIMKWCGRIGINTCRWLRTWDAHCYNGQRGTCRRV